MDRRYYFWGVILGLSLMTTGLCIRSLALQGIPFYESLSSRGLVSLILAVGLSRWKNLSLIPKKPLWQILRALLAGLALTLITLSYGHLTASSVSVLSNMDVPLLIVLGPVLGMKTPLRLRMMASSAIVLLIICVSALENETKVIEGVLILGGGILLLCLGYFFIKKSMSEENEAITIAVPSLAILIYGLVQGSLFPAPPGLWGMGQIFETVLAGVGMFFAYFATMKLYALTDLATAEFPALLSSLLIQPVEWLIHRRDLHFTYFLSSVVFVFLVYGILMLQKKMATKVS